MPLALLTWRRGQAAVSRCLVSPGRREALAQLLLGERPMGGIRHAGPAGDRYSCATSAGLHAQGATEVQSSGSRNLAYLAHASAIVLIRSYACAAGTTSGAAWRGRTAPR